MFTNRFNIYCNTKIIDKSNHWSLILYQESIAINIIKPSLNHGTKASKDLLRRLPTVACGMFAGPVRGLSHATA